MRARGLARFREAQDRADSGFDCALAELRVGCKHGHWIWYIFPQLSGLGISPLSETYGIGGLTEAEEYVQDPVLCARLLAITETVAERVREGVSLRTLMSSHVDVLKLVSSLTLFDVVAEKLYVAEAKDRYRALARVAEEVLAVAESEGYSRCRFTLNRLACLGP